MIGSDDASARGETGGNGDRSIFQKQVHQHERSKRMTTMIEQRVTVNPNQCGGRPCVRGMRIRVSDVLDLLANDLTPQQILEELPDLESADISACIRYASQRVSHAVVVP